MNRPRHLPYFWVLLSLWNVVDWESQNDFQPVSETIGLNKSSCFLRFYASRRLSLKGLHNPLKVSNIPKNGWCIPIYFGGRLMNPVWHKGFILWVNIKCNPQRTFFFSLQTHIHHIIHHVKVSPRIASKIWLYCMKNCI